MTLDFIIKLLFAFLINGFGLIIFWSFHYFKIGKKDNEYLAVVETFGLKPKFEADQGGKEVLRKPSTVFSKKNFFLPVLFFTLVCSVISALFLFPNLLFRELFDVSIVDGVERTTLRFAHNPFFMGMFFGNESIGAVDMDNIEVDDMQRRSIATLAWGFVGAFLWSANNMVRRLGKADVTPVMYYKASFRILYACGIALIFSFIASNVNLGGTDYSASFVPALAFLAGMLPERFFAYLMSLVKSLFVGKDINTEELHLSKIEGLDAMHRERLWEEGIDSAQNLAETSVTQLLLRTPFEARQVLDWIGQAKLLVYMKEDIGRAHAVGIRSAYDLISLYETYTKKGLNVSAAMQELGQSAGLNTPKLAVVADLANNNLGVKSLKAFMDKLNGKRDTPELFENEDVIAAAKPSAPPIQDTVQETTPPKGNLPTDIPSSYD